jgi:TatD DNase family protein
MVCVKPALIDSHCHLDLEPLASDVDRILKDAAVAGVNGFVVPGVNPDGWTGIKTLAAAYPQVYPAFGIHPMHAGLVTEQLLDQLQALATKTVAIGEIGLDPVYQAPMFQQDQAFREQLRIAVRNGLPVLIHCRQAFQKVLEIMRDEHAEQVGGIMHAYSGSVEMARQFVRLGFAISISGTVTWSNAVKPLKVAKELPLEHLVLETDAPDMTPERHRGVFNRPAWITETALKLAELRGITLEEVARITTDNVRRVLRLAIRPV